MNSTASLQIGELASRSGFSIDTLRYYERLGLIPLPERTSTGRRAYDERALERLQFIARAKELGCTLDEIADLVTAFDDDCTDVAGRFAALVDGKITEAQRRVAELVALTAQLQRVRGRLASGSTEGPCGPDCACSTDVQSAESPVTGVPLVVTEPGIACALDDASMASRMDDWQSVLASVERREPVDDGVRLVLGPATDVADLARLVQAEWTCCSFFGFALTIDGRGTALEVRAPAEAADLVASVFGVAS